MTGMTKNAVMLICVFAMVSSAFAMTANAAPITSGTTKTLYDVAWHPSGSYAIVVGSSGMVLKVTGTTSTILTMPSAVKSYTFYSVAFKPNGEYALLVGASGKVVKYDGSSFTVLVSNTTKTLRCVDFKQDGSIALVVGDYGTALLFNGKSFVPISTGTTKAFYAVAFKPGAATFALLAGYYGTVIKYDGTKCSPHSTGMTKTIRGIEYRPSGDYALLVGDSGKVLQFHGYGFYTLTSGTTKSLYSVGFKYDGSSAIITGTSGTYCTFNAADKTISVSVMGTKTLYALDMKPNSPTPLCVGYYGTILTEGDSDGDGVSDSDEVRLGTNPNNPDTDGDGFWDGIEINKYKTDPKNNQFAAATTVTPWAGYWWPMSDNGTWEPCRAYDMYCMKKGMANPGSEAWENRTHGARPGVGSWWGHCHAWSSASIMEAEPKTVKTKLGVTFTVGYQKGLLTEIYYSAPCDMFVGERCDDPSDQASLKAPSPLEFQKTLQEWIGTKNKAFVADIFAAEQVWNYPAYKYQITISNDPSNANRKHFAATVYYVTDGVQPDYVGNKGFSYTYYYYMDFRNGDVVDSQWEKTSADYANNEEAHPDFMWHTTGPRGDNFCPLKYDIIKEIVA